MYTGVRYLVESSQIYLATSRLAFCGMCHFNQYIIINLQYCTDAYTELHTSSDKIGRGW